ncbi:hypothetical protein SBA6_600024 [Candidatus Sulfopaludibacter sp. SbA6]|nr:hypothetical protein SBA6_600024 [Candidatus Sulfopaludibacter sp. SbA6]
MKNKLTHSEKMRHPAPGPWPLFSYRE